MYKKFALALIAAVVTTVSPVAADDGTGFPVAGQTYLIHRYNNENSYVYENGNLLYAAPRSNTQKQYWQFIPTDTPNRYYIQNVTSKRYLQSTAGNENAQVRTGATPVEYEVKVNESTAAPRGYYYMCSADQAIDATKDGTLGLNFQESTGKVVAYHIRQNRGNSYWEMVAADYDYEAPAPVPHTAYAKRLGIYQQPCGSLGAAWLKACDATGEGLVRPMSYTAAAAPSDYWMPCRNDSIVAVRGKAFELSYDAAGIDDSHAVTAYMDWDGDGLFEVRHDFFATARGSAEITVPDTAKLGKVRLRIRLTDNGLEGADDDVTGTVYDFPLYILATAPTQGPVGITPRPERPAIAAKASAYGVDGRRVDLATHRGVYIRKGEKRIR